MARCGAVVVRGSLPRTRIQQTTVDCSMDILEKQQGAVAEALGMGKTIPIQRHMRLTEAVVTEAVAALHQAAEEESWTED